MIRLPLSRTTLRLEVKSLSCVILGRICRTFDAHHLFSGKSLDATLDLRTSESALQDEMYDPDWRQE